MSGKYDDIMQLPHHVSARHPRMAICDRAAQFLPFAALTGYDAAVRETARLTAECIELDENSKAILDTKLRLLLDMLSERPEVAITHFQPDERKAGGAYVTITGAVKKIDEYEHVIIMMDGAKISINHILEIEGELFKDTEEPSQ